MAKLSNNDLKFLFNSNDISQLRVSGKGIEKIGRWNFLGRLWRKIFKTEKDQAVINKIKEVLGANGLSQFERSGTLQEKRSIQELDVATANSMLKGKFIPIPGATVQKPAAEKPLEVNMATGDDERITLEFGGAKFILNRADAAKIHLLNDVMGDTGDTTIPLMATHTHITRESVEDALNYVIHNKPIPETFERRMNAIITLDYMLVDKEVVNALVPSEEPSPLVLANYWFELPKNVQLTIHPKELLTALRAVEYKDLKSPKAQQLWRVIHETNCDKYLSTEWTLPHFQLFVSHTKESTRKGLVTLLHLVPQMSISIDNTVEESSNLRFILENIPNPVHMRIVLHYSIDSSLIEKLSNIKSLNIFCCRSEDQKRLDAVMDALEKTPSRITSLTVNNPEVCKHERFLKWYEGNITELKVVNQGLHENFDALFQNKNLEKIHLVHVQDFNPPDLPQLKVFEHTGAGFKSSFIQLLTSCPNLTTLTSDMLWRDLGLRKVGSLQEGITKLAERGQLMLVSERAKALTMLSTAAKHGHLESQMTLGRVFYTEQNFSKALEYYTQAALQGDKDCQYKVGLMYYNGEGTAQDYVKALEFYKMAASQGIREATYMEGWLYFNGWGCEQDYLKAFDCFTQIAEKNDSTAASANNVIGYMYYHGKGVKQDYAKALLYMQEALQRGLDRASSYFGICYYHLQDYARAVEWLEKLPQSDPDYDKGQQYLGECYLYGRGTDVDKQKAIECFTRSATPEATALLKELINTKERLAQALQDFLADKKEQNPRTFTKPLLDMVMSFADTVSLDDLIAETKKQLPGNWAESAIRSEVENRSVLAEKHAIDQLEELSSRQELTHQEVISQLKQVANELIFYKGKLSQENQKRIQQSAQKLTKIIPSLDLSKPEDMKANERLKELWEAEIMAKLGLDIPYHLEMDTSRDEQIARDLEQA